jgi:hypothetical protein
MPSIYKQVASVVGWLGDGLANHEARMVVYLLKDLVDSFHTQRRAFMLTRVWGFLPKGYTFDVYRVSDILNRIKRPPRVVLRLCTCGSWSSYVCLCSLCTMSSSNLESSYVVYVSRRAQSMDGGDLMEFRINET